MGLIEGALSQTVKLFPFANEHSLANGYMFSYREVIESAATVLTLIPSVPYIGRVPAEPFMLEGFLCCEYWPIS